MENTNHHNKQTGQVFINFRGKDKRNTFLSYFKQKLIDSNVNVFTDEDAPGEPHKKLLKHIRNSKVAVVIFSPNYGESFWCLQELVEIKKCMQAKKLKAVIPIFHMVKASAVKKQSGEFGEKFLAFQESLLAKQGIKENKVKRIKTQILSWKKALEYVCEMNGYFYDGNGPECAFVEKMVKMVKISLAKIATEEGRNIIQENMKETQQSSNHIVFNIKELNINREHFLDSLNLGKWNPLGYSMIQNIDTKPPSRNLKRTNSDLDLIYGPFPVEAIIAHMREVKNQGSIDNIVKRKTIGRTTWISYLSSCFCLA